MSGDVPQWVFSIIGTFGGAFGAYVAIRADLAALKSQVAIFEKSLERAHERIDSMNRGGN